MVKLLDFGLSRSVGASGAQTFAGTPEYFAPEVDPRKRPGGALGSYGVAADCWSLGAVIFVMLSGVFPEFTGEGQNRRISFARKGYWGRISKEAKDLIAQLMHPNPSRRLTMAGAAEHPWLKGLVPEDSHHSPQVPVKQMATLSVAQTAGEAPSSEEVSGFAAENGMLEDPEPAAGSTSHRSEVGLGEKRVREQNSDSKGQESSSTSISEKSDSSEDGPVVTAGPAVDLSDVQLGGDAIAFLETDHLYLLQQQLASLFHEAYRTYAEERDNNMTRMIRMHAVECRQLFKDSAALMRRLGATSDSVMRMIPDLRIGVEENTPELAETYFAKIRNWIKELKTASRAMMDKNSQAIRALNMSMENAKQGLYESVAMVQDGHLEDVSHSNMSGAGVMVSRRALEIAVDNTSPMIEELSTSRRNVFPEEGQSSKHGSVWSSPSKSATSSSSSSSSSHVSSSSSSSSQGSGSASQATASEDLSKALVCTPPRSPSSGHKTTCKEMVLVTEAVKKRVKHLQRALTKLSQVDRILGGFSMFWDHMETAVSVLSQRNEHVESLLSFTKNPRLKSRFFERLDEYKTMWLAVKVASGKYATSDRSPEAHSGRRDQYKFLALADKNEVPL